MRIIKKLILFSFFLTITAACSTLKQEPESYDAVRIKKEIYQKKIYDTVRAGGELKYRNGAALKGKALRIETYITKCRERILKEESFLVFKDSEPGALPENIPLEHIDLIGEKPGVDAGKNWFEHYNDPLNPPALREIPVDTIINADCGKPEERSAPPARENICECSQLEFGLEIRCPWANCRDNYYKWYFIELRAGFASYTDKKPAELGETGKTAFMGEIAAGVRFGGRKQWGIGLVLSSGVPLYNSKQTYDILDLDENGEPSADYRPTLMLHGRYAFEETFCLRPFIYGQFGLTIDDLSLDLANLEFGCSDCKRKLEAAPGELDLGLPLSFGMGIGVDVPIACMFDFSFDIGFRSIGFGEKSPFPVFGVSTPERRRVNMFVFRFGVTI